MSVTVPAWFDLDYYLSQKVEQMNNTEYDRTWLKAQNASNWSSELVQKYIAGWPWQAGADSLPGDTIKEKAYSNFLACNAEHYTVNVGIADINVSGTPFFDVAVYLQNLADYHNAQNPSRAAAATVQSELQALIAAKTSAWAYFQQHWSEMPQVNPSNNFDLAGYVAARAEIEGVEQSQVIADIAGANITPIEDFSVWGQAHGMTVAPKPATPTVPQITSDWSIWGKLPESPAPVPPAWSGGGSGGSNQPTPEPVIDPYDKESPQLIWIAMKVFIWDRMDRIPVLRGQLVKMAH